MLNFVFFTFTDWALNIPAVIYAVANPVRDPLDRKRSEENLHIYYFKNPQKKAKPSKVLSGGWDNVFDRN